MASVLPDLAVEFGPALAAVLGAFFLLTIAALAVWIYQDAVAREAAHPIGWAIVVAVLPFSVAGYVLARGDRIRPPSDRDDLVLTLLLGFLGAWIVGPLLSPPDSGSQAVYLVASSAITLPLFYLLVYRTKPEDEEESETEAAETSGETS